MSDVNLNLTISDILHQFSLEIPWCLSLWIDGHQPWFTVQQRLPQPAIHCCSNAHKTNPIKAVTWHSSVTRGQNQDTVCPCPYHLVRLHYKCYNAKARHFTITYKFQRRLHTWMYQFGSVRFFQLVRQVRPVQCWGDPSVKLSWPEGTFEFQAKVLVLGFHGISKSHTKKQLKACKSDSPV